MNQCDYFNITADFSWDTMITDTWYIFVELDWWVHPSRRSSGRSYEIL